MDTPACAVGRIGADGPWIGFAPTLDDGYAVVVGDAHASARVGAETADLIALAIAYFEEALDEPPEDLAATHGDIGSLVRHVAEHEPDPESRSALDEAVDAIDDGLASDEVIRRLVRCLPGDDDALATLTTRVEALRASAAARRPEG